MGPLAQSDGPDFPRAIDERIPGVAAVIDDIVVGFEDAVREPVVAHVLPDVFNGIEFGGFRRQGENGDVGGDEQSCRQVPSGLIDQEDGVGFWCDRPGDFREVQVHRFGIAEGQDESRAFALFRADGTEDIGRCGSLIPRSARASAALGPPAGNLVLLADTSLVLEPDFYLAEVDCFFARDFIQARWEVFLKSSMTPSACA
jgi:hypothetical protein